jgi:hypothetical protein
LLPLLSQGQAAVDVGCIEFRLGRKPGSIKPLLPRNLGDLLLDFFIPKRIEEVEESLLELEGVETLASPRLEVMWDELVKVFTSNQFLQIPQKMEAFLIRYSTECIFGVYTLVANDELGELMVSTE